MKPRLIPIVIGVILALAAAMMTNAYLAEERQKLRKSQVGMEPKGVLVATQDIPEHTALTEEMVQLVGIPEKFIQPYALANPAVAVGNLTAAPIAKGEQILGTKLVQPGAQTSLAARTPPGQRAVTIIMDPVAAVGGFVQPGDHVDILWTASVPQASGGQQAITLTLIQRALILAVDNELMQGGASAPVPRSKDAAAVPGVGAPLTFALSPADMELLLFAQEQGKLQLALRPHAETDVEEEVIPVSIEAVKEILFGAQRAAAGPPQRQVEVYRGLEKAVVSIPEQSQ